MKALSYLLIRKLKNNILSVFKTPSKLIAVIALTFIMVLSVISGYGSDYVGQGDIIFRDINELYGIILLLYSFVFVMISKNGFYNGASMFSMADVNMIFTSPLKQGTVLSFGLFQQLGRSLLIGYVILFQYSLLNETYGISLSELIYILIGYGITVFLSQMTAMVIYSFTCGDDKKCTYVKTAYYLIIIAFIVYAMALAFRNGGISVENLVYSTRSTVIRLFPVSGMMAFAVEGAIEGQAINVLDGVMYCVVFWIFYRIAITLINSDYYEDVLQSAEVSYSVIQSRRDGKVNENAPRKVKLGKTGLNSGYGAAVIAQKHKLENRRSRIFLLSTASIFTVGASIVGCFVFKDMPIGLLVVNIYILTMSIGSGRWGKELSLPYVYMIPEKSYKKLFYTLKGEFAPLALESILCFIPAYFIMQMSIYDVVAMAISRISFGLLFLSVNLLLQRIFSSSDKKVLLLMIYFVFILLFSVPGISAAIVSATFLPFYMSIAYLIMSGVNTIVAAILAFCCRNVFNEV